MIKQFLKQITIFTFLLVALNWGFASLLDKIYFNEYYEVELDKEIYILADSHGDALGNLNNGKIYNFSAASDSYRDMKIKLEFLIEYSDVETILLIVDNHTLSPYRDQLDNRDRSAHFARPHNFPTYYSYVKEKFIFPNVVLLSPKYGSIAKTYIKSLLSFSISKKCSWSELSEIEREKKAQERFEDQFSFSGPSESMENYLDEIIKICRMNRITLFGIKFPISTEYHEKMSTQNYGGDLRLQEAGIEIWDFSTYMSANQEYFKDQDHLNSKGANEFNQILKDAVFEKN